MIPRDVPPEVWRAVGLEQGRTPKRQSQQEAAQPGR
jgi:hypothetical protein